MESGESRPTETADAGRVAEVYRLRLGGAELPDLIEYASSPERAWGLTPEQVAALMSRADALVREYAGLSADPALIAARQQMQRRQLYAHAMGAGDWRTALAVLREEAQAAGLVPGKVKDISDEQLLSRIAELRERVRGLATGGGAAEEARRLSGPQGADGGGQPQEVRVG